MSRDIELLGEQIAEQAAHLDAAMHRLLTDLREFDIRGGWRAQGASSCAHWLAWRVGWDLVTARDRVRVARKLGEFSGFDDALRRGELSYSKVRALVRIATPAIEAMLLDQARMMTASQLETTCRKYALVQRHGREEDPRSDELRRYVRRRDTEDGMVKIEAMLQPEEAELVWTMLDHAARRAATEPLPSPHVIAGSGSTTPFNSNTGPTPINSQRNDEPPGTKSGPGDSAESCARTPTAPVSLPCNDGLSGTIPGPGDSAESCATHDVDSARCFAHGDCQSAVTSDGAASQSHTGPTNASAVSRDALASTSDGAQRDHDHHSRAATAEPGTMQVPDADVADPIRAHVTAYRRSAQMSSATRPDHEDGRPPTARCFLDRLLDRLLDEVDALRPIEATMDREPPAGVSAVDSGQPPAASVAPRPPVNAARRAFNRADGLVAIAQSYLRGDRPDRSPIEVTVTVPASCLRSDAAAAGEAVDVGCVGSSCISPTTARRLSCDAAIIDVVEDEHGVPLSVGRKRRTIAGSIKRALLKRDTSCTFPGCTHRVFLEGHHIQHWADGGATSLGNTVLLCTLHHRHVHEYGFTVELGPDRRPRFRDPRGQLVPMVPERLTPADLGWPRICADNAALNIDASTIACEWDGSQAPYAALIDHLVMADHRARSARVDPSTRSAPTGTMSR